MTIQGQPRSSIFAYVNIRLLIEEEEGSA